MEPGKKLTKKSVFQTLCALAHVLWPMIYHSEFRLPTSEFQYLSSVFRPLFSVIGIRHLPVTV